MARAHFDPILARPDGGLLVERLDRLARELPDRFDELVCMVFLDRIAEILDYHDAHGAAPEHGGGADDEEDGDEGAAVAEPMALRVLDGGKAAQRGEGE